MNDLVNRLRTDKPVSFAREIRHEGADEIERQSAEYTQLNEMYQKQLLKLEKVSGELAFYARKCPDCGDHLGLLAECPHCREIKGLQSRLDSLQDQDEVHWKTRRSLLHRLKRCTKALEDIAECDGPHDQGQAKGLARIAREALDSPVEGRDPLND